MLKKYAFHIKWGKNITNMRQLLADRQRQAYIYLLTVAVSIVWILISSFLVTKSESTFGTTTRDDQAYIPFQYRSV